MLSDEKIRRKLEDRNLAAVARKIGVTRSYLCKYMKGGTLGDETKVKLVDYLLEQ